MAKWSAWRERNDDALPADGREAYLDMPLSGFLSALAAGEAAPGAGSAAAVVVAAGACLCAMTARLSARQLTEDLARKLTAEAERLRAAADLLIEADADSFEPVLAARRLPVSPEASAEMRKHRLAVALSDGAMVPMQIIEHAAQAACLMPGRPAPIRYAPKWLTQSRRARSGGVLIVIR